MEVSLLTEFDMLSMSQTDSDRWFLFALVDSKWLVSGMPGMMPATMTGTEGLVAGVAGVEGFPSVVAAAAPLPTPGRVG